MLIDARGNLKRGSLFSILEGTKGVFVVEGTRGILVQLLFHFSDNSCEMDVVRFADCDQRLENLRVY